MTCNQVSKAPLHFVNRLEYPVQFRRKKKPQQPDVLAPITVHSRVLQHSVSLRRFWVATVIADEQVLYCYTATELVAADEKVIGRFNGNIFVGFTIHKLHGDARGEECNGVHKIFEVCP